MLRRASILRLTAAASLVFAALAACVGSDPETATTSPGADASVNPPDTSTVTPTTDSAVTPTDDAGDAGAPDADGGPITVVQIALGVTHACVLRSDASVWCWGSNIYGESGAAPPSGNPLLPTQVAGLSNVTAIGAGTDVTCAIESDGSIWCWGNNSSGQLGHNPATDPTCAGSTPCNPTPTKVDGIFGKLVRPSNNFTCALSTGLEVFCWGTNDNLNLGVDASIASSFTPLPVAGLLSNFIELAASYPGNNACAIDKSHELWCWGNNRYGQLGHAPHSYGDFTLGDGGPLVNFPLKVTLNTDGGADASVAVEGAGDGGPFDFGSVSLVAASTSTCAVRIDGTVWCWGQNSGGELGNGTVDSLTHPTPVQVQGLAGIGGVKIGNQICARADDAGTVSCWSLRPFRDGTPGTTSCTNTTNNGASATLYCDLVPTPVTGLNVRLIEVSDNDFLGIDSTTSEPVMFGRNDHGQLGHAPSTGADVLADAATNETGVPGTSTPVLVQLPP